MEPARKAILDLLLNGPSSLAALHGFLARAGVAEGNILWTWKHVEQLESAGLVSIVGITAAGDAHAVNEVDRRAALDRYKDWLGQLRAEDLSVDSVSLDEIGLWCALTKRGQAETLAAVGASEDAPWVVDFDEPSRRLVVHATDEAIARQVLSTWLKQCPGAQLIDEPIVQLVERFTLRSGIEIRPAVRLVVHCRTQSGDR